MSNTLIDSFKFIEEPPQDNFFILLENDDFVLLENNDKIILE